MTNIIDVIYRLRDMAGAAAEPLRAAIAEAQDTLDQLEVFARDAEDAAQLVASSDIAPPGTVASIPERAGLFRARNLQAVRDEVDKPPIRFRIGDDPAPVDGSHRYQILIPQKRFEGSGGLHPQWPGRTHDAFDYRLPASFERVGPVTIEERGDDYRLTALVIDTGKPLCHYRDIADLPCVKEADHEDWCRTVYGDEWLPYDRRRLLQDPGTPEPEPAAEEPEEQLTDQCQQRTWCALNDGHPGRHERADGKRVISDNPQA